MTIRPSGRVVVPTVPGVPVCTYRTKSYALHIERFTFMACCVKRLDLCIAQGADKTFRFVESETDLTGVSEITFDIWAGNINGTSLVSLSLTGSDITVPDPEFFQFSIDRTTSGNLAAGRHYCEAWVTSSEGDRLIVGAGKFEVQDTRKHDA